VAHKPKTPQEKEAAIVRNARIALKEMAKPGVDPKYRARLGRTVAMEKKLRGPETSAEVIDLLKPLTEHYRNYPEGRQAAADISRCYMHLKDYDACLAWAKKAGPSYEAVAHHLRKEYPECVKAVQRAAGIMGRQGTHEGLLVEAGLAYLCAADAVLEMGGNAVQADAIMNRIPVEVRMEPQIASIAAAVRKQVNRITIVVPGTPQPFDENGGGGMLGGSEEAVMYLSRALAVGGRNVRVFAPLPPQRVPGLDTYGVDWQEVSNFGINDEHGTLVVWRSAHFILGLLEAKHKLQGKCMPGINSCFLWLHDAGLGVTPEQANIVGQTINGAVVLSEYHAAVIRKVGFTGPLTVLSNGIPEGGFLGPGPERDPNRVIYSSCPSRGLVPLLEMWPEVKAAVPAAKLDIYYDWGMLERAQPEVYDRCLKALQDVAHLDVVHHGGVDHDTLHQALRRANVWAYSHFESTAVETSCISVMKAAAAGCTVLTVPNGALPETGAGLAHFVQSPVVYREWLINYLKAPESAGVRAERSSAALDRFGWHPVAKKFSDLWRIA
jgi:hypothetical protein